MEVDPLASMRCWAIDLELGGRTYEIPALPAMDWWPVLVSADKTMVLDFLVSRPEDPFNVDELLLLGEFTSEEIAESLTDEIERTVARGVVVAGQKTALYEQSSVYRPMDPAEALAVR